MNLPYLSLLKIRWMLFLILFFIISYFFLDRTLVEQTQYFPNLFIVFSQVIEVIGKGKILIPSIFLCIILFYLLQKKSVVWRQLTVLLYLIFLNHIFLSIFKILFGRMRPYMYIQNGIYGFKPFSFHTDYWSFPSGHTLLAFTIIGFFAFLYPSKRHALFAYGFLVCLARVAIQKHYLSDVVVTAYLGLISIPCGLYLLQRFSEVRIGKVVRPFLTALKKDASHAKTH